MNLHISINHVSLLMFPTSLNPSVYFLGNRLPWLTSKSDDGEGCEGNEGSTQDKALPILFSIAELL
jgi:hypothetical protein